MKITPNLLQIIKEIQSQYDFIYIGGSVSLILQNAIPSREIGDIDLISTQKINISTIFNQPIIHARKRTTHFKGFKFELFRNPKAQYVLLNEIKLSPIDEIFEWKLTKSTHPKHQIDYANQNATISRN